MNTPLYLRDLNEGEQAAFLRVWEREGRRDLIEAHAKGKDINMGEYAPRAEVVR